MEGWIKLHRQIIEWEWFDDDATFKVFVWLILNANHEQKNWRGLTIERGQIVTSLESISTATRHSVQSIRTILNRLKSTGEITSKSTNKFSIITICNYDSYQSGNNDNQQANQQANQQTNNKQITNEQQTTNNKQECKELNNVKNAKNSIVRFTPPTIEQVKEYCNERKNTVDAVRFVNFYEMKGWMVGKNKMKDWKAAVRNWESSNKTQSRSYDTSESNNRLLDGIWDR